MKRTFNLAVIITVVAERWRPSLSPWPAPSRAPRPTDVPVMVTDRAAERREPRCGRQRAERRHRSEGQAQRPRRGASPRRLEAAPSATRHEVRRLEEHRQLG